MNETIQRAPRRWWQLLRKILRRVRWCTMSLALVVIAIIVYFANFDLPDKVKLKLETELRQRGVDLQIAHLRWIIYQGIVAEEVQFGPAKIAANQPHLSIREIKVKLAWGAIIRRQFNHVDSLELSGGKFTWLLSDPDEPPEALALTDLQARLQLLPNDQWELSHFTAGFAGLTLQLSGSVTNASAFRDWKIFQGSVKTGAGDARRKLHQLVQTAGLIHFAKPPTLNVLIRGDARDPQSFSSQITLEAEGTTTPWGTLKHGQLNARLTPPGTNGGPVRLEFKLRADAAETRWGGAEHINAELHAAGDESQTNMVQARLQVLATGTDTQWIQATNARFSAQWSHSLTNPLPAAGKMELRLTDARTPWADADEVLLQGTLNTPATNGPRRADATWGWWANLEPCAFDWNCRMTEIRADDFESKVADCTGSWHAPMLTITNLHTEMYRGQLQGSADLDVGTRILNFAASSDFDLQKAYPFLTPEGRQWCQDQAFTWEKPPVVHAGGRVVLPAWTNRKPDFKTEMLPTLNVYGDFAVAHAGFRQVPVNSAQSHFSYSNQIWNLPDLMAVRPEGAARVALRADHKTKDFYCHLDSRVDVKALRGLLDPSAQKALDFINYAQPPVLDMELWGRFHDNDRIGFKGHFALTNFTFRGESGSSLTGTLAYTNLFLLVTDARLDRPEGYATVSAVGVDIPRKRAFMTNGFGTMDAMALVRTLGPKITSYIEPYHFAKPPVISAYGVIPLSEDVSMADLHYKIEGGPFAWAEFHSDHVAGTVDWVGQTLHLNLAQSEFYGGTLKGTADFNFTRIIGADFKFDMVTAGANLKRLMTDLTMETNHEGTLSGRLNITQADTEDLWKDWNGNGWVELKNGSIWEIPIFGVISPLLDKFQPGLGESRASEARATFTITKSVIRSDDLEIRSPVLRIYYRGTVSFGDAEKKVNALAEAEVGRDAPVVGPVISSMLFPFTKLFETKVTGTLKEPKHEARYPVTRMMIMPIIHPWQTLKDLFPGDSSSPPSESAPAPAPAPDTPNPQPVQPK